jgi:hypothetical protein
MSNAGAANADAVAPAAAVNAGALGEDEGHPARWLIMAVLAAVAFMAQLDRDILCANVWLRNNGRSRRRAGL